MLVRKKMKQMLDKETSLTNVLERLEKELGLQRVEEGGIMRLKGGVYVIRKDPLHLEYIDRVATARFDELNMQLAYLVVSRYLGGQIELLRESDTTIGKQLVSKFELMRERKVGAKSGAMRPAGNVTTLNLPDFSEAYKFIRHHILH